MLNLVPGRHRAVVILVTLGTMTFIRLQSYAIFVWVTGRS